ncbi:MAG: gliding motility-associated C-terminal domain-containing protein, partial [Flavobacteriia bacterium]|nr:gliding motility-associated C-terminal domain-containing protein [Flavobacteriia bacterium]
ELPALTVQLVSQQDISCNGANDGSASVSVSGGTPLYTYSWTNSVSNNSSATDLSPGSHTLTVTDVNNCSAFVNLLINEPSSLSIIASTPVSCVGGSNGTATAQMTSLLGTVSYNWYDAGGQTTATATGLGVGTYHCEATSTVGCIDTVAVVITQIPTLSATLFQQDVACNGGSNGYMAVTVSGGTPQYTYSWNNSSSTGASANDLSVGQQTVTITDANNCVLSMSATLAEPTALSIVSITPVTCQGGSNGAATVSMTSTLGTVSYNWYDAGGQTTASVSGMSAGTYHCEATSTVGCSDTIVVIIPELPPMVIQLTQQNVSCNSGSNGSVTATVNGGTPSYSYSWSNNASLSNVAANLVAGTYVLTVTDNNNCATTASATITEPLPLTITSMTPNQTICPGNPTTLSASGSGGSSAYTYSASATHTFNSAQSYDLTVTITSIYGCVYMATMNSIVSVIANPVADFNMSANPTTIFETTVTMQDKSTNGVSSWAWSSPGSNPSSSVNQNPTFHFPDGVVAQYPIVLVVQTPEGCIDSVEHILSVNSDVIFYAPNSFTPDGNEFNQNWLFYVSGIDEYHFELLIFDRWGEIIWETHDVHSSWDGTYQGKIVPQGAYSWIARVKDLYSDSKQEFNGLINVLR